MSTPIDSRSSVQQINSSFFEFKYRVRDSLNWNPIQHYFRDNFKLYITEVKFIYL